VQSNCPTRYFVSPAFGVVHNNQMRIVTVEELVSSDMGLVRVLFTGLGGGLEDQIVVLAAKVHGSIATMFSNLPVAEKAEAITEYFLVLDIYRKNYL